MDLKRVSIFAELTWIILLQVMYASAVFANHMEAVLISRMGWSLRLFEVIKMLPECGHYQYRSSYEEPASEPGSYFPAGSRDSPKESSRYQEDY
jgi:hypothetical protein